MWLNPAVVQTYHELIFYLFEILSLDNVNDLTLRLSSGGDGSGARQKLGLNSLVIISLLRTFVMLIT